MNQSAAEDRGQPASAGTCASPPSEIKITNKIQVSKITSV